MEATQAPLIGGTEIAGVDDAGVHNNGGNCRVDIAGVDNDGVIDSEFKL